MEAYKETDAIELAFDGENAKEAEGAAAPSEAADAAEPAGAAQGALTPQASAETKGDDTADGAAGDTADNARDGLQKPQGAEQPGEEWEDIMRREVAAFAKAYPGVREFPPDVLDMIIEKGCSPIEAYQNHLLTQQAAEIGRLKKLTTPGSIRSAGPPVNDEFLEAFDQ